MTEALSVRRASRGFLAALAVGGAGAAVFYHLDLPLPFVLGPMYACLAFNLLRPVLSCPMRLRRPVVAVIGVVLGTGFSPEMAQSLGAWIVPLVGLAAVVAATILFNFSYYRAFAGFDPPTALFASAPGGLTEMVIIGGRYGGRETDIALTHSARILLVVMLLPWVLRYALGVSFDWRAAVGPSVAETSLVSLALVGACAAGGALLGQMLRLPAPAFVGPMAVSAALHVSGVSDFRAPSELVVLCQLILGISVGVGSVGVRAGVVLKALLHGFGSSLVMILIGLGGASAVALATPFDPATLLLAFAPGGFPEMSLLAYAMGGDVALVAGFHVLRLAIVLVAVPIVARRLLPPPGA